MKSIMFHHGSPGTIDDFNELIKYFSEYNLYSENRFEKNHTTPPHNHYAHIGYSFGCTDAIINALKNDKSKKIVLIAPYLFPQKFPSPILKNLLKISPFKNILFPLLAKKKIIQMINEGSHPDLPPESYLNQTHRYLNPNVLSHSVLEKSIHNEKIIELLDLCEKKNIDILVIVGENDQTIFSKDKKLTQFDPLLKYKNIKIQMIPKAGHALLWTKTKEIAKLIHSYLGSSMENDNIKKFGYYEGQQQENNVASFLKDHVKKFPHKKILTWISADDLKLWNGDHSSKLPHQSVTVSELDSLVSILSSEFKKCGINKGDRVILFLPMSLYMYAAMFALQKLGAIPTFLDSWARRDQMGVSAKVASPKGMISSDRAFLYLNDIPEINEIQLKIVAGPVTSDLVYSAQLEKLIQGKTPSEIAAVDKEHTALITFTTGSSGTPKGADRSHRFLAAQHYALNRHLPYTENDKDLPVFPIFSLNNLAAGVETIVPAIDVGAPSPNDAAILYAQMLSCEVTCTTLSPSLFNALSTYCLDKKLNLNFLKRIVTGGAPISRDDIKKMKSVAPKAQILVLYGSTEVEPMAHIESNEMLAQKDDVDSEIVEAGVNVGLIDNGLKYKFIKINKETIFINNEQEWTAIEQFKGVAGELIVAGEHVCERYFNNEEAFFRSKIKDHNGIIWHRTGDLGFLDSDQNLWIVGRVHNAIQRKGDYFFPVRAEIIIKKFDFVDKAAFLGIEDKILGEKTIAVFSLKNKTEKNDDGIELAKKEIIRVLEKNKFIVDEIICIDDIQMDPRHHSKVEYDLLKKRILGNV
jgi:acyl-CoA synthetase (AMP-forming)/AMP-acid ligase II/pimeloyl-ACP methyl ester carboxylesterase